MKLHLPSSLRKSLILALSTVAATLGTQTADASVLFDGVGIQTYADFGQNCGRFVAGEVNAMLTEIREREGGIVITYQASQYGSYTISSDQGMIDFASASSNPVAAAVGYAYLATVSHNGVIDPTYTALEVGDRNAVRYSSIDFKRGTPFHMEAATDYKIARLNKIVTDVQPSEFYSGDNPGEELDGEFLYRTGAGAMDLALIDEDGVWRRTQELDLPYSFATGGIVVLEWADNPTHEGEHDGNFGIFHHVNPKFAEEIAANPLPYRVRSGDSGSPTWVWNPDTKTYQYISAGQSGGQYFTQDRGDLKWSEYAIDSCGVKVELGTAGHTITLSAVATEEAKITGVGDTVEVSTIPYSGILSYTDANNTAQSVKYIGIESGKHTWLDLSPVKDQVNWFNYGNEYFNVAKYGATDEKPDLFSFADMFETDNLVFVAGDSTTYDIVLQDNVDLGIGYVQLSKKDGVGSASFKLQSDYLLESAGFAIDEGVSLELDMKAYSERMVEWRKAGAGNLTIIGSGDTNALLNVGGSGTVSLKRKEGYASYNVLASSGSTLVINDLKQVYRDVTLGAGGATLDLNGNNFTWNNSAPLSSDGFKSLHMLVEKDVVTNNSDTDITITIEDPGTEAFVGAFKDVAGKGAIKVVYNSSSEKPWVMNTVFTKLQNEGSSFTVENGSVILQGTNTVHGKQLLGRREVNEFDWHYADAAMDVTIEDGAEFTLGSHARLKGNVTVENGGTFTMTEYTTHQYEYMEGGVKEDNTYDYREYFGLHGDVNLAGENSTFNVQFTPQHYYQDTDSESVYDGKITGSGGMVVNTAGGSLKLSGQNTFSGAKELLGGTLVATGTSALGNTSENKWLVYDRGVLAVETAGAEAALAKVDGDSNGVLALTQDETGAAPDLRGHQNLIIGAVGDVQFGAENTQQTLATNDDNQWLLGGGGGTLYVNYKLDDEAGVLVLGNQYTTGRVVLTNTGNHIKRIELVGGVSLEYDSDDALGGAKVSLDYGNRMMGSASLIRQVTDDSEGAVLLDQMSDATINLTSHGNLSLAADKTVKFTGTIDLGENDTYHFGGGGGHLALDTVLTDGEDSSPRHMVVDGQFYRPTYGSDEGFDSGDIIELKKALQITGDVTVQGFDFNKAPEDDPTYVLFHFSTATLQLSVNNALESVHSLVLADGGFVDMNGTTQTLHGMMTDEPTLGVYGIVDNSDCQTSKLILDVSDEDCWGPIFCNLRAHEIVKTGDSTLVLAYAVNESSLFTIEAGTVEIYGNDALNSRGLTRVVGSGILDASGLEDTLDNKTIELNDGGTMLVGSDAISGSITATGGTGIIDASGVTATLNATIGAEADSTLVLRNGSFTLSTAQNNAEGGTIDLQGTALSLSNADGVAISGTLKVSSSATVQSTVNGATHQLNRVEVANGVNLTVNANNKSSLWNIHALDGSGNVTWQPGNNAEARLTLDGEGTLSGTLTVAGRANPQSAPGLVLAHDLAAQHATVLLQDNASMAVNTANARMAGLNGNATSAVYAYEAAANTTLTTTGSGTYIYNGSIGGSAAMNIVMDGTGSQTYAGTVNAADVSALKGTLNLQGDNISIAGDVTVARGAKLATSNGFTLEEGQYLCTTGVTGDAGIVEGAVTFNGGGLRFDASGLNGQTAALNFTDSVTHQSGLDVVFTNTNCLNANTTLVLTSGYNWGETNFSSSQLEYLTANFIKQGSELKVSFIQKEGNRIWDGTASQHTWSNSAFGQGSVPGNEDTAVFNDSAQSKDVQVSGDVTAKALLFDNSEEYTVSTTEDSTLSAQEVSLKGTGVVTLGAGVAINKVDIAAGSTLVLQAEENLQEGAAVTGAGTLALDTGDFASVDGLDTHIGCVEVRSGALGVSRTLTADDLVLREDTWLLATTGSILDGNAIVHSAGHVEIEIESGSQNLNNAIAAGPDGSAGTFAKEGAGTLNVRKSLVADTVEVNGGRLDVSDTAMLPSFLTTTKQFVVNTGSSAYIGHDAYTINLSQVDTDFVVNGGRLELAIAQNTTRTITGDLTINSGELYKVDGGLIFTGTTTLGNSIEDEVTLAGNWGKAGTIFDGLVKGAGKVTLTKGNAVEKFTFNHADNTFSGEIEATAGTQLVAGNKTALAKVSGINLQDNSTLVLATGEVDIKTLSGSGAVEFSPADDSSASTLNITNGSTFNGSVGGNISISKTGSDTLTLTGESSQFNGDLTVEGGTMKLENKALGMLGSASSVTVKENATFRLGGDANVAAPMDIQGTLSMGGKITSRDTVHLSSTSHLTGNSHTLQASSLVIDGLLNGNVTAGDAQTLNSGSILRLFGDSSKSITLPDDVNAAIYTINNVQDVILSGSSLTINLSGVEQQLQPGQWMGITLGGASQTASIGTDMLVECVMGDGQKMQGYYLGNPGGNLDRVYFTAEEIVSKDLIWDNATKNSNWSTSQNDRNWHAPDAAAGSSYFTSGANVQFDAGKNTVTLADNITAGDMVLVSGADVSIVNADEYIQEFANVTIAENARLSFDENCSTTIGGTLALAGTVSNEGYLEIGSATVAAGATGVIAGEGMTILTDTISNAGTVMLDHAELVNGGEDSASITGNIIIKGAVFLGAMELGSTDSTIAVTEAFTISGDAEYIVLGNLKLDDLAGAEFYYAEGEQDVDNNGFFIGMDVKVFDIKPFFDPEAESPIDFNGSVTYKGMKGEIEYGVFTAYVEDYTTFHVNVATAELETYSHAKSAGGDEFTTVALANGTSFDMDSDGASLDHVIVEDGAAASVNIASTSTIGDVQVGDGLTFTGNEGSLQLTTVQGSGSLTVDGPTVTITGDNASYTGDIVVSSGTLKAGNHNALGSMNAQEHSIRVLTNGTLDVNGLQGTGAGYTVELAGGTLTNSGGNLGYGMRQLITHVSLTADSKIAAAKEFGITGSDYAATSVDLGTHTLEKKGTGTFHIQNATVTGTGKIKVSEGTLAMSTGPNAGAGSYSSNFEMAGGTVSGKVSLGGNIGVDTTKNSTFSATINTNGYGVTFTGDKDLNVTGTVSGNGNLTNNGTGVRTLSGANNAIAGLNNSGSLILAGTTTATGGIANTGTVSVVGTGASSMVTFNVNNGAETMNLGNIALNNAELHFGSAAESRVRNISTLTVDGAAKLTQNSWNNLMHIASLTNGEGTDARTFTWQMNTNHYTNSVLYLDGAGDFSGTFVASRGDAGGNGAYQGHLQVNHQKALQNAVMEVNGANASNYMSVALNADTVETSGVKGNANAIIYAGEANTAINQGAGRTAPASTRDSVLAMNVAEGESYNYAGKLESRISLQKSGTGTQEFSGSMTNFHGSVDVEGGILNIMNAASVDVKDVTIGANATLGVYKGAEAAAETANEGTLTIKDAQRLTAKGEGSKLNANLVMETGSTLDVSATGGAGLALGSTLTLNQGMDMSAEDYANVAKLLTGETYVLFNGVDGLTLGETTYTEAITPDLKLDAAGYYQGLESGSYYLVYNFDGSNVGSVAIFSAVPEPATSTLGLLALAALAARRRRK